MNTERIYLISKIIAQIVYSVLQIGYFICVNKMQATIAERETFNCSLI